MSVFLISSNSFALPVGTALEGVFNDIAIDSTNDVDVYNDYLSDGNDAYWNITATNTSAASFVIELAGYTQNSFGIYDRADKNNKIELFSANDTRGDKVTISIEANGKVTLADISDLSFTLGQFSGTTFGYYINVPDGVQTYYSDSLLNADNNADHMLAYRGIGEWVDLDGANGNIFAPGSWGSNEWILAFEDLWNAGDQNFTDLVVMVESVQPVPEPATMFLLGTGIIGLAGARRKKKN